MIMRSRTVCYELTEDLKLRAYFEDDANHKCEIKRVASDRAKAEQLVRLLAENCALPSQVQDFCTDFN